LQVTVKTGPLICLTSNSDGRDRTVQGAHVETVTCKNDMQDVVIVLGALVNTCITHRAILLLDYEKTLDYIRSFILTFKLHFHLAYSIPVMRNSNNDLLIERFSSEN
jgi:hypothetical protein